MIDPTAPFDDKARHLRRLYRQTGGEKSVEVQPEYERLFPERDVRLDQILVSVWKEARELAGWTYDRQDHCWRYPDGSRVLEDTGAEYAHL